MDSTLQPLGFFPHTACPAATVEQWIAHARTSDRAPPIFWYCLSVLGRKLEALASYSADRSGAGWEGMVLLSHLRDVQLLAGHRSIETPERYIDGDTGAQRRLVAYV